ncbi:MAG: TetR/AcrR family transcriptional regulator [Candidatus Binatia bacterium]|nr:TetR/AcrR family transcriptional regulator [Candidatus Binatia bacterium]
MLQRQPDNRPASRVQEQGARSRERILDAAEALMADRGYAGASISSICKESGLPASSVYWHFENKEGLLQAVMERGTGRMLEEISAAYEAPGPPRERLHRMLRRAGAVFEAQPREFQRLEMMITLERGQSDDSWRAPSERLQTRLRSLIEEALFEVYRSMDETLARKVAEEGALLAGTLGNGATIEAIRNPEEFDPAVLIEQLEIALIALGEHRLRQSKRKNGAT